MRRLILLCVLPSLSVAQSLEVIRPVAPVGNLSGGGRPLTWDWDGSGSPDVLLLNSGIQLFTDPLQGSTGPLASPITLATATNTWLGAIGDLNGDAYPDILTLESPPFAFQARFGGPGGNLSPPTGWASANLDTTLFGDFDGNGRMDVCTLPSLSTSTATLWLTGLAGTPSAPLTLPFSFVGVGAVAADVNGDGLVDIVRSSDPYQSPTHEIILGDPTGSFGPATVLPSLPLAGGGVADYSAVCSGDLDGDGFDDVVINSAAPGTNQAPLSVMWGHPTLLLVGPVPLPFYAGTQSTQALMRDMDQDGVQDLLVVHRGSSSTDLTLLRGVGNRSFSPNSWTGFVTSGPVFVAADDFDQDGDADVFVSQWPESGHPGGHGMLRNHALVLGGCAGQVGTPTFALGPPVPGNQSFGFNLGNADPNSYAAIYLSLGAPVDLPSCGPVVDLQNLVLPTMSFGVTPTTANGTAFFPLPLPNDPLLIGTVVTAQWGVLDPSGNYAVPVGLPLATSNGRSLVVF